MKIFAVLFTALTMAAFGMASSGQPVSAANAAAVTKKANPITASTKRKVLATHSRWRSHYRWGSSRGRPRGGSTRR